MDDSIREQIYEKVANLAGLTRADVNDQTSLEGIGLDSADAVILAMEVEELVGKEVEVGLFLRCATVGEAVEAVAALPGATAKA